MNQTEAVQLIAHLNRAGLVQALDGQAAVWADALDDIRPADAMTVARELIRQRTSRDRWVVPGDVRDGVKRLRGERIQAQNAAIADLEPPRELEADYPAQVEWRRLVRDGVGDGFMLDEANARACNRLGVTYTRACGEIATRPAPALTRGRHPGDQLAW